MTTPGKIIFANQLRGIAALLVVISHLAFGYWRRQAELSVTYGAPVQPEIQPLPIDIEIFHTFNLGVIGVAIFFLISGFVIPFSTLSTDRIGFIISRAFRIYPTYWICLIYTIALASASAGFWGVALKYSAEDVVATSALIGRLIHSPPVDLVSWSLEIEVKFYILVFFAYRIFTCKSTIPILALSILIYFFCIFFNNPFSQDMMMIVFMLCGSLFNLHIQKRISTLNLIFSLAICLTIFFFGWNHTPYATGLTTTGMNYAVSFAFFAVCYGLREKFNNNKLIDFFADISYPLYLVHAVGGFVIIHILTSNGFNNLISILTSFFISVTVATLIHNTIEKQSNSMGKSFIRTRRATKASQDVI